MVDKIKKKRIKKKNDWSSTKYFFVAGEYPDGKKPSYDTTGKDLLELCSAFQEIGLPEAAEQID